MNNMERKMPQGGFCPYYEREIGLGQCLDICTELGRGLKENEVITIQKRKRLKKKDMIKICNDCPNFPMGMPL